MESYYVPVDEDINGITLSPELGFGFLGSGGDDDYDGGYFGLLPVDFDPSEAEVVYVGDEDDPTNSADQFSQPASSSALPELTKPDLNLGLPELTRPDLNPYRRMACETYFPAFIIILMVSGAIASFVGFVESAINRKRNRHYYHFLHIFFACICVLLPLPFTLSARFAREWRLGDASFKALSVITSATQTACALQLTYLVWTRCREVIRSEKARVNGWTKIICSVLWLIAFASAWPCAIYDSTLADLLKSEDVKRSPGADLYIKVNTAISLIFPVFVAATCFVVVSMRRRDKECDDVPRKVPLSMIRGVKKAAALFILFCICWLPYRVWRLRTLTLDLAPGCGVPSDVVLCIAVAFSTLLPILHFMLEDIKSREGVKVPPSCGENKQLSTRSSCTETASEKE